MNEEQEDDVKEGMGCILSAIAIAILFSIPALIRLIDRLLQ